MPRKRSGKRTVFGPTCTEPGCRNKREIGKKTSSRFCPKHKREHKKKKNEKRQCSAPGCDRRRRGASSVYCAMHQKRKERHGFLEYPDDWNGVLNRGEFPKILMGFAVTVEQERFVKERAKGNVSAYLRLLLRREMKREGEEAPVGGAHRTLGMRVSREERRFVLERANGNMSRYFRWLIEEERDRETE